MIDAPEGCTGQIILKNGFVFDNGTSVKPLAGGVYRVVKSRRGDKIKKEMQQAGDSKIPGFPVIHIALGFIIIRDEFGKLI